MAGLRESDESLLPGDLLISLNGKAVSSLEVLRELLGKIQSGSSVVFQIHREEMLRFIVLEVS
jgi:S1-C subfamily serine protease